MHFVIENEDGARTHNSFNDFMENDTDNKIKVERKLSTSNVIDKQIAFLERRGLITSTTITVNQKEFISKRKHHKSRIFDACDD